MLVDHSQELYKTVAAASLHHCYCITAPATVCVCVCVCVCISLSLTSHFANSFNPLAIHIIKMLLIALLHIDTYNVCIFMCSHIIVKCMREAADSRNMRRKRSRIPPNRAQYSEVACKILYQFSSNLIE